jgi:hypothetical protein
LDAEAAFFLKSKEVEKSLSLLLELIPTGCNRK